MELKINTIEARVGDLESEVKCLLKINNTLRGDLRRLLEQLEETQERTTILFIRQTFLFGIVTLITISVMLLILFTHKHPL